MSAVGARDVALVVSLSNIGDAVMTTPVIEALHRHAPGIAVDIVADRRSAAIFEQCPYRRQIFLRDKRAGWRGIVDLIRALRRTRYRCVVDLRTDGFARLLRTDTLYTKPWRPIVGHAVERHFAVIRPLVGPAPIPAVTVWLSAVQREAARARVGAGRRTLALGPGANSTGKIWPAVNFATLAMALDGRFDQIVLLGNTNDAERVAAVAAQLAIPVINLAGVTDLLQAAAVLAVVDVFVGNDSGLGHLAAAVGTPVVTVFGPGEPARYKPWGAYCEYVVGSGARIENVTAPEVADCVRRVLSRRDIGADAGLQSTTGSGGAFGI